MKYNTTFVTPKNLYRYKLGKIIMTGIFIGIHYENNNDNSIRRYENNNDNSIRRYENNNGNLISN